MEVFVVTRMINGLGYYEAACCMVLRLLCMMIDALRYAGIVHLPGTMTFLHHHILYVPLLLPQKSIDIGRDI